MDSDRRSAHPKTTAAGWSSRERARELGDRIRERRKALRLSQEQLGERCGIHRTYIGQIERGDVNVTVRNLMAVAEGLGVDVGELVQGLRRAG